MAVTLAPLPWMEAQDNRTAWAFVMNRTSWEHLWACHWQNTAKHHSPSTCSPLSNPPIVLTSATSIISPFSSSSTTQFISCRYGQNRDTPLVCCLLRRDCCQWQPHQFRWPWTTSWWLRQLCQWHTLQREIPCHIRGLQSVLSPKLGHGVRDWSFPLHFTHTDSLCEADLCWRICGDEGSSFGQFGPAQPVRSHPAPNLQCSYTGCTLPTNKRGCIADLIGLLLLSICGSQNQWWLNLWYDHLMPSYHERRF